ncbi:hypothetical protein [Streptomyces sp. NPDC088733]|uniref:hypothetical protein n=1 Tax=Streptomyces sp. NPDC088733 TaxID=3365880 RepID=UPI003826768B
MHQQCRRTAQRSRKRITTAGHAIRSAIRRHRAAITLETVKGAAYQLGEYSAIVLIAWWQHYR